MNQNHLRKGCSSGVELVGFVELAWFVGLLGFVELGVEIFYKAGAHFGYLFCLRINTFESFFVQISLVKGDIQMTLDFRT